MTEERLKEIAIYTKECLVKGEDANPERLIELIAEVRRLQDRRRFEAACAAMQGICSHEAVDHEEPAAIETARMAVIHADALLAELAKGNNDG